MARIPRELTPEERAQLEKDNKRQYSATAAILWAVCAVAFAATVGFDVAYDHPILKIALHALFALLTGAAAVRHFIRWRKMKAADAVVAADSADTP